MCLALFILVTNNPYHSARCAFGLLRCFSDFNNLCLCLVPLCASVLVKCGKIYEMTAIDTEAFHTIEGFHVMSY